MSFNTLGQYTGSHKAWDHVGNNVPNIEISEGIRPAEPFKVAEWLPTQFYDKYYENYFVVLAGKVVALDNDGDVVPAQYATSSVSIIYTATDVAQGVVDVTTGAALTTTKTVAVSGVTTFLGGTSALAVSKPIGIAPYSYLQWAGGDGVNPANYRQHNYNMQHAVAVLCDYYIELPLVPATTAVAEALTQSANALNVSTMTALSNLPVAENTTRTPFTFAEGVGAPGNVATKFAVEQTTLSGVQAFGDWYVDLETGIISVWSAGGIGATDYTLVYSHYASAPTSVAAFASAVGDLDPGDFVKCDTNSNYQVDAAPSVADTIGQVLAKEVVLGKDLLDRVRTGYSPALGTDATGGLPGTDGQLDQMPGSATGGVPDNVHYAGGADTVVRINLINR